MEIRASWYGNGMPVNCKGSAITIGSLPNGQITVTSTEVIGEESNNKFDLQVVAGVGASKATTATFSNDVVTITLGTNAGATLDDAKNIAELVTEEINDLDGFSAVFSGDGSGVIAITAQKASAIVGDGETANSYVTVTSDVAGVAGNSITIEVENGLISGALAAGITDNVITLTLGMDAATAPDPTKNTASAIATAIDNLAGVTAVADGTGEGVPAIVDEDEIQFAGGTTGLLPLINGQDATMCADTDVLLRNWNVGTTQWDYYINIAPNGKHDSNWRIFNLTEY